MAYSAEKLLALAEQFEKKAVDIPQPLNFEDDYKKWKEMQNPTPADDEGAYEKWLKETSTFDDPKKVNPEMEALHSKKWLEEHRKNLLEPRPGDEIPFDEMDAMNSVPDTYIRAASDFEALADQLLVEAKDKKEKKLDPKAKVRNRGTVCVPASSAKDKKDHFPINDIDQARNALARVHQYSSVPEWYSGSLKGLQALVSRKVHSKYPAIGKEDKKSFKK